MKKILMLTMLVSQLFVFNAYADEVAFNAENLTQETETEVTEISDFSIELFGAESKFTGSIPENNTQDVDVNTKPVLCFDGTVDIAGAEFTVNGEVLETAKATVNADGDVELLMGVLEEGTRYTIEFTNVLCDGEAQSGSVTFITGFVSVNILHTYEGDTIADYYERNTGASSISTDNGAITINTNKTCSIYAKEQNISTADVKTIVFTIESDADFNAKLYWSDKKLSGFAEERACEFFVTKGGAKKYYIPVASVDTWNGMSVVKGLRLYQIDDIANVFKITKVEYLDSLVTAESSGQSMKIGHFGLWEDDAEVTDSGLSEGEVTSSIDVIYNASEEDKTVLLILAYYGEDGSMEDIKCKWITVGAGEKVYDETVSIEAFSSSGSVKAFIRNGLTDITSVKSCSTAN